MSKSLREIVKKLEGVKSSNVVKGSLGDNPGVDYSSKNKDAQNFEDMHKREEHSDRVGNKDDIYSASKIKPSLKNAKNKRMGYKNIEASMKVNEESSCNMSENGKMCEIHGKKECPGYSDKKKKYKKLLADSNISERKMTPSEVQREKQLKHKYDPSGMKDSMKKQYGDEEGEKVYFATIRDKAMSKSKKKV